jgi:nucleoside phosphorylase
MNIGMIIALRSEVPGILTCPQRGSIAVSQVGASAVGVLICGVGPHRAMAAAERLCREWKPDALFSLGYSGAIGSALAVGDLVAADSVVYRDEVISVPPGPWRELSVALPAATRLHVGRLLTSDSIVLSRRGLSPAVLAVDMESWSVAKVAHLRGLPVSIIRAISDIVPDRLGAVSTIAWLRRLRGNARLAQEQLDLFVRLYFSHECHTSALGEVTR